MRLMVNPGLSTHPFHGDAGIPMAVCEVPDHSGRPRRYMMPAQLCELLPVCDGGLERAQAVALMAEKSEGRYTAQQLEQLTEQFLIPRQLLLDPDVETRPPVAAPRLDRYLYFKVRFLKKELVQPLARKLQWLFQPSACSSILALSVFSHLWFYLALMHHDAPQLNALPNASLPWFLLLFSLGGMLHEFGHATALNRFGGRSAEIGFGIYICFAALFVDLSEAWRFTNRQRVIVDLGGLYFQAIFLIVLAIGYAWTGSPVLACCFLFTDLEIAGNLNPLLRLDGYWALSDGLGIPNLRSRTVRYLLLPIFSRAKSVPTPQIQPRLLAIMRVYFAATVLFSLYLVYAVALQCAAVLRDYPRLLQSALHAWQSAAWFEAASSSFAALWRGLLLAGLAVAIFRALMWVLRNVARNHKESVAL
jgi:putative peptide zinc metalloprotease protein